MLEISSQALVWSSVVGDVGGVMGGMTTSGDRCDKEPIAVGKRETCLGVEYMGDEVRGGFEGEGTESPTEFSE